MTIAVPARTHHVADEGARQRLPTSFGVLLLVLASALLAKTLLGPLVAGVVTYDLSDSLDNQLLGLEVVTTTLVVPLMTLAGVLALRDRASAPLLAFGPAAYAAYMLVQYVLGPEYAAYSLVVLFDLALMSLAGTLALWAWALSLRQAVPRLTTRQRRWRAVMLLGFAGFMALRYFGAVTGALTGADIATEFAQARTFYWSIFLLDLGVVVPATVIGSLALLRGTPAGDRAPYAAMGWFALVPASVASMAVTMVVRDDPNASVASAALLCVASLVFAWGAVVVFRPLLRRRP